MRKLDRPSRLSMLMRRQKRLLRPALLAAPLLGLGLCGLLAARGAVEQAGLGSWFRHRIGLALPITRIVVQGERLTSPHDVTEALGMSPGDPIMGFSIEEAERNVEALPFVETAIVQRHLPGTVVVELTERKPFAVWQDQGRFQLIDRTGTVVQNQGLNGKDAQAFARLPLVVGAGAPPAAAALIDALDDNPAIRADVVAAVRVGQRRWNLTLRNGCDVLLPEAEAAAALRRLSAFEHDHKLLERPLVAIDMRLPDRLVLRPVHADPAPSDGTTGTSDDPARKPA